MALLHHIFTLSLFFSLTFSLFLLFSFPLFSFYSFIPWLALKLTCVTCVDRPCSRCIDVVKLYLNFKYTNKLVQGVGGIWGCVGKGEGEGASRRGVQPSKLTHSTACKYFMAQKGNKNSIDLSASVPAQVRRASCCVDQYCMYLLSLFLTHFYQQMRSYSKVSGMFLLFYYITSKTYQTQTIYIHSSFPHLSIPLPLPPSPAPFQFLTLCKVC